jgi:hypothetical protein
MVKDREEQDLEKAKWVVERAEKRTAIAAKKAAIATKKVEREAQMLAN